MLIELGYLFHKPAVFKVFIDFSVDDKLSDSGNSKCKDSPAGDQENYGKNFPGLAKWHYFTIPHGCNGNSGHKQSIHEGASFYDHVAHYSAKNNYMKNYKWLQEPVGGTLQNS